MSHYHISELQFGIVREVDGASVRMEATALSCMHLGTEHAVELGSFVLIAAPQSDLMATISSIQVVERQTKEGPQEIKVVTCTLVGFLRDGTTFERGIERYPTVGTPGYLLAESALTAMFSSANKGIILGTRCQRGGGLEHASIDRLFGRHTAVLGTSGSGKSWAVASILQSAMKSMPHTRFLFLDIHDEYRSAFPQDFARLGRKVKHVKSSELRLPYWLLTIDELEALFVSSEHAASNQSALLRSMIQKLKVDNVGRTGIPVGLITVDTPIPYPHLSLIAELTRLNEEMVAGAKSGEKQGPFFGKLSNLITRLTTRAGDPRYGFLFPTKESSPTAFTGILHTLFGTEPQTQMTILDLSGLPSEVLSIIVGIIARLCFEYKYWEKLPGELPLTLILEEAHNYIPRTDASRHEICLERIEKIAKEGRKYGVGLLVISQRPSEVSETILSQCANFIALRLTNPNDQQYVRRLLPDFLAVAVDMLPYLRTGEAIISGEAVDIPTRIHFIPPDPVPRSQDVQYMTAWTAGLPPLYDLDATVGRWLRRERE